MARTYTQTGAAAVERIGGREALAHAIEELVYVDVAEAELGFSQGYAIRALISEFGLPLVEAVAEGVVGDSSTDDALGLYGIRCNYANGEAAVYALDLGTELVVACSDFEALAV